MARNTRMARDLLALDAPTPWSASTDDPGVVLDANGDPVLVVDQDNLRADADALQIATMIVTAINVCAGAEARSAAQ